MSPGVRHHRARRLALQGLCCLDVQGPGAMEPVRRFIRDGRDGPETVASAEAIVEAVFARRDETDRLLAGHAEHWDIGRMALVDRNVLRLAVWELLTGHAPRSVVVAEALKLADEFSATESPRFVNGVIDAVARRLERPADQSAAGEGPDGPA